MKQENHNSLCPGKDYGSPRLQSWVVHDIKKVYSIWICTSPPAYSRNTITAYRLEPINVFGNVPTNPSKYNVLEFVIVCLSDDFEKVGNETVEFLNVLLSTKLAATEKKAILESQFNIKITEKFGKINY